MIQTCQYSLSHPVVFLMDHSNDAVEIPSYDLGAVTSCNEMCICVRALADVDGDVTVFLGDEMPPEMHGLSHQVYAGPLRLPSGSLAIVTAENCVLLQHSVGDERAILRIFVDEEEHPAKVWVVAHPSAGLPRT